MHNPGSSGHSNQDAAASVFASSLEPASAAPERRRRRRRAASQSKRKAIAGIVFSMLLLIPAAVGCYLDYVPGKGTKWAWLILPAVPLMVWGCAHLAKYRGYPGVVAYGLFFFACLVSVVIVVNGSPAVIGVAGIFLGLLPTVVLLALPKGALA